VSAATITERRARLAALEGELMRLGAQYDLAMSHFKFHEARDLQAHIAEAEHERQRLAGALPAAPAAAAHTATAWTVAQPGTRRRPRVHRR